MRAGRTIQCSSCGARWAAATARFCGWCGMPLRRPTVAVPERRPRRWHRGAVVAAAAAVSLAVVSLAANGLGDLRLPRDRPDPLVELAEEEVVPEGAPLTAEERAEALAPFDPDRLRCEPDGCERWRVDLAADSSGRVDVIPFGETVVAMADGAIHAYDVETGGERWQTAWPAHEGTLASSSWITAQTTADGQLLVVARPDRGTLLALDPDGELVWSERAGGPWHNFAVAGDVALVSVAVAGTIDLDEEEHFVEPPENLEAFDARTGESLWAHDQVVLMNWSDRVLVVREGHDIVLLDLRSGVEVARREASPGAWLNHLGAFAVLYEDGGAKQLLDGENLEVVAGLDDFTEVTPVADDSFLVGVRHGEALDHSEGGEQPDRVSLIEADGSVRWEVPVKAPSQSVRLCCPQPRVVGEALVITAPAALADQLRFALADGADVAGGDPGRRAAPSGDNVWWLTPDTALQHHEDGVRLFHDDAELFVRGQGVWPVTTGPPFLFTNGRSLLSVQAVPTD